MNLSTLKDPFVLVVGSKLPRKEKHERLLAIYKKERAKAMNLYGNYSITKINWLIDKLIKAQRKVCET